MGRVNEWFKGLKDKYHDQISIKKDKNNQNLMLVPEALRELYEDISEAKMPFGYIYSIEKALKTSDAEPFKTDNWFVFDHDNYFSSWVCSYIPDEDGLSFTYWDHESGLETGEVLYKDIIEFLEELQSEYEENLEG